MGRLFQWAFYWFVFSLALQGQNVPAKQAPTNLQSTGINQLNTTYTLHNINNWSYWLQWNGVTGRNPQPGSAGALFPSCLLYTSPSPRDPH